MGNGNDNSQEHAAQRTIQIGDAFMITSNYFQKYALTTVCADGKFDLTYGWCKMSEVELSDMLFEVHYIGEGVWQEKSSGIKIRISTKYGNDYHYFDISDMDKTIDDKKRSADMGDYFIDVKPFKNDVEQYKKDLALYKSLANEVPIIYCGRIREITNEVKDIYDRYPDEERKRAMMFALTIAKKSKDEVIKSIDSAIAYYSSPGALETNSEMEPHL